eukprot:TRINITY_DN11839_c0_g1_i1.p1 TRINITY_DN11839_c0_g1~~TRINITY_DN11839_c0_g1_i1.p1  ORF type:complete len:618 (-),score=133.26 TRINITY_DN11839_c0_g1_i1:9-1862(-)
MGLFQSKKKKLPNSPTSEDFRAQNTQDQEISAGSSSKCLEPKSQASELAINVITAAEASLNLIASVVASTSTWGSEDFIQSLFKSLEAIERETVNISDSDKFKRWSNFYPNRKQNEMHFKGRSLTRDLNAIRNSLEKLKIAKTSFTQTQKREFFDTLKQYTGSCFEFYRACEETSREDIEDQREELSKAIKLALQNVTGNVRGDFDLLCRIFMTESVKLARMANLEGLVKRDAGLQRRLNDCCFTIIKASKVFGIVGQKLVQRPGDEVSTKNIANITKGVVQQLDKMMLLLEAPTNQESFVWTTENVDEFEKLYAGASKEINDALDIYVKMPSCDPAIYVVSQTISSSIENLKNNMRNPNVGILLNSTSSIASSLSQLCYYIYRMIPSNIDHAFQDNLMICMQNSLHYSAQMQLIACMKALYHPMISLEISLLSVVRLLSLLVSIIISNSLSLDITHSETQFARSITDILQHGKTTNPIPNDLTNSKISETKPNLILNTSHRDLLPMHSSSRRLINEQNRSDQNLQKSKVLNTAISPITHHPSVGVKSSVDLVFPSEPPKPFWKLGGTEYEYKQFMIAKYKHEQWENSAILFKRRVEEGNFEAAQTIINRVLLEINS